MFFQDTLKKNLTLGVKDGSADAKDDRILAICRSVGLHDSVLDYLQTEDKIDWSEMFSQTQKIMLHLARALIANFEITCLHKPTQAFGQVATDRILKLLQEHVSSRGLEQNSKTLSLRRPRTV